MMFTSIACECARCQHGAVVHTGFVFQQVASSREHIIPVVLEEQNQLESRREGSVASVEDNTQITRNKKLMESSQEAARVWGEQQLKQEATRSESSFSKTYSSSSSSSSSAQQQFSSHNVF